MKQMLRRFMIGPPTRTRYPVPPKRNKSSKKSRPYQGKLMVTKLHKAVEVFPTTGVVPSSRIEKSKPEAGLAENTRVFL